MYDPEFLPSTPTSESEWMMQLGAVPDLNDTDHITAVIEAVENLKPKQREAIEGIFYERISYAKLAERLGCSKPHAWRITHKAMNQLQRSLITNKAIVGRYNMFESWEEAVKAEIEGINLTAAPDGKMSYEKLLPAKKELIDLVNRTHKIYTDDTYIMSNFDPNEMIATILFFVGISAVSYLKHHGQWDAQEQELLMARKQHDYGHGNILNFGQPGIAVRVCDKIARLESLASRKSKPENESVIDTWVDIVGYSVISQMIDNGTFLLGLKEGS